MRIRVATYNIHACIGNDGRFAPERILEVLRELDADVLALQEVEHHRVEGRDLLDHLAAEGGYQAVAGHTLRRESRAYGNAVLTRLPITSVERIDLSQPHREPRGALNVELAWRELRLQIVATHLGLQPAERRKQVRRLLGLSEDEADRADLSILLGDLNEWLLWGRPLRWLHRRYAETPHVRTYPARLPLFALDRVWVHPRVVLTGLRAHSSAVARLASDHLPLIAELNWPTTRFE